MISFKTLLCRFYCAGAADNRTRLDFHGVRRIWDGRLIKQKIKGNSALYIYTDEVFSDGYYNKTINHCFHYCD